MNDINVSYVDPTEKVEFKSDEICVIIPFVGIYQSNLDADIESAIERDAEYYSEEGEDYNPIKSAKVDLKAIYKHYFEYALEMLGWDNNKNVRFGGIYSPQFYNYQDDTIYAHVKKDFFIAECKKYGVEENAELELPYAILEKRQNEEVIDLEIDGEGYTYYDSGLYFNWYDGKTPNGHSVRGHEVIDNNIEYEHENEEN